MAREKFPSDDVDRLMVRFPPGMRDELKRKAEENNRSMNAEIISRLKTSLVSENEGPIGLIEDLNERLDPGVMSQADWEEHFRNSNQLVRRYAETISKIAEKVTAHYKESDVKK